MITPRYFAPPRLRIQRWRMWFFVGVLSMMTTLMIIGGIFRLHNFDPHLQAHLKTLYEVRRVIPSHHGTITDRNGEPLAMNANVYHAVADPGLLRAVHSGAAQKIALEVAAALSLDETEVREKLNAPSSFVYLKKKIPPSEAAKLRAMNIKGLSAQYESARFYPGREMIAPLLGYLNDVGGQGLDRLWGNRLRAEDGEIVMVRTSKGGVFEEVSLRPAKHGGRLILSVDSRLQAAAYNAAVRALRKHKARAVSAAVMDARNGDILALASAPSFNPNNIQQSDLRGEGERTKNRVISDLVECGSLAKPFVVALAFELGLAKEKEKLPTKTPVPVGRLLVRDSHIRDNLTVAEVLTRSSNVGAYLIAQRLGKKRYHDFLRDVGFGGGKILGLQGEASGVVRNHKKWRREDFATHAYGYGFSATLLELLRAYSIFAADGMLIEPRLAPFGKPAARRVLSAKAAQRVRRVMAGVTEGTAKLAAVDGYEIAGKTGTAKKFINGEYRDENKRAFFVGMAPSKRPRYVIAVMVDEPRQNGESGGSAAAPVFSEIMRRALIIGGVPPQGGFKDAV